MDQINKLIGLKGGTDSTFFEVLAEVGREITAYYPAVIDDIEKYYWEFASLDEYVQHKVKKERMTVRMLVAGNPVAAEDAISRLTGHKCMSTDPHTVDIYITQYIDNLDDNYLTPAEAAIMTDTAASGWRNRAASGKIPGAIKKGKQWLIPRSAIG